MKTDFKNIPKGVGKVDKPDHPFAFDGPDMLLYNSNGLLAIFYLRSREIKSLGKLIVRLTNALIVYPPYTRMIFLYDHSKELQESNMIRFDDYFDEVIEPADINKAESLLLDRKGLKKINDIRSIQKVVFNNQAIVQKENIELMRSDRSQYSGLINELPFASKAKYHDQFLHKEVKVRAQIYEYENNFYAIKKTVKYKSEVIQFQPFYEFSIKSDFLPDRGVAFFRDSKKNYLDKSKKRILFLYEFNTMKVDPLKPLRIANLLNWCVVGPIDSYLYQYDFGFGDTYEKE